MHEQPDERVLFEEMLLLERWEFTRGQLGEGSLLRWLRPIIAQARKTREDGYGNIIDAYWPHLADLEAQEQLSKPPYPVALHSLRAGEPARPEFVWFEEADVGTQRFRKAKEERKKWVAWAREQPDAPLLRTEYAFYQMWFYGDEIFFKYIMEETESYLKELRETAKKLRAEGYGELIDNYWKHLV